MKTSVLLSHKIFPATVDNVKRKVIQLYKSASHHWKKKKTDEGKKIRNNRSNSFALNYSMWQEELLLV